MNLHKTDQLILCEKTREGNLFFLSVVYTY